MGDMMNEGFDRTSTHPFFHSSNLPFIQLSNLPFFQPSIRFICSLLVASLLLASCKSKSAPDSSGMEAKRMAMLKVTSTAFAQGEAIPRRYTCDGENVSPALAWENVPEKTKSLAIICDDPDAPRGVFAHWVLYNLPRGAKEILEDQSKDVELPDGARQGMNDFREIGYGGPCPPAGKAHRFIYHVYALDAVLHPVKGMTRAQLLMAMDGHIQAQGELMGKCSRK